MLEPLATIVRDQPLDRDHVEQAVGCARDPRKAALAIRQPVPGHGDQVARWATDALLARALAKGPPGSDDAS